MQFTTIVHTERIKKDAAGRSIRLKRGGFDKEKIPAGTSFEGEGHVDLVVFGYAVPSDEEAKALVKEMGLDVKAQIKGRKIVESTDLVTEIEGE